MAIPVAIHVNPFYSDTVLVPLAWVALAGALARVLERESSIRSSAGSPTTRTPAGAGAGRGSRVAAPIAALVFVALFHAAHLAHDPRARRSGFGTCLMLFFMLNML